MAYVPVVTEQSARGERQYDLYSRMLQDRIIFLGEGIDDMYANLIIAQLLFLDANDTEKDIYLYINSPGGYITAGLAIYDTMQYIHSDIRTICIGQASNIASLLLTTGKKGKRSALPNARIMLHQPIGGVQGQSRDIEIQAEEILNLKKTLTRTYSKHSNRTIKQIDKDLDRISYMSAEKALSYGMIDNVIGINKEEN